MIDIMKLAQCGTLKVLKLYKIYLDEFDPIDQLLNLEWTSKNKLTLQIHTSDADFLHVADDKINANRGMLEILPEEDCRYRW